MNLPRPDLMAAYGTDKYYLEKTGAISRDAITAVTGALFMGAAAGDQRHLEQQIADAHAMNDMFRAREHARMAPVIAGFKGASAGGLSPEDAAIAERMGQTFARLELAKEAMPAMPFTGTARMMKAMAGGADDVAKAPGLGSRIKGFFQGGTTRLNNAAKAEGLGDVAGQVKVHQKAGINPTELSASLTPAQGASNAHTSAVAGLGMSPPVAAAPGKSPIVGWKGKALAVGATAGLGYAGYKGVQSARDYMSQPQGSQQWGYGGPTPKAGVNQFGYPQ